MAAVQDPNFGLFHSWSLGESGWNTGMDGNLQKIGAIIQLAVISATTSAQPGSPTAGDRYIIPTGATGTDWTGKDGKIAVYAESTWFFYTPAEGWITKALDTDTLFEYRSSAWAKIDLVIGDLNADTVDVAGSATFGGDVTVTSGLFTVNNNAQFGTNISADNCIFTAKVRLEGDVSTINNTVDLGTSANSFAKGYLVGLQVKGSEVDFTSLPTSDPSVAGRLWNDSGTVKISAG